ncbi:34417_t:CDS:2 [Gigaspora margarita]|uniref:Chitin synthase n=1 Tax=Gigaspora margarita TaxID=4874 RepID=A0ABN7UYX8_GIGMA|nr:34417_t:CDS:2 [Gigaspora margarita]
MPKRAHIKVKPVKLTNGNLVFEYSVPNLLLKKVKYTKNKEFTDIRYTAITCNSDEFEIKKYLIRQKKYNNPHVGGTCGEIKVDLGYKCRNLLNPLIAFQNFEYKMSNILDKLSEFVFSETMYGSDTTKTGIFEANMYLAEDRILSFELVIKKNESWKLKYVKGTKGDNINIGNLNEVLLTEKDPESIKINIFEEGKGKNTIYESIIQELKNKDHEEKKYRNNIIKKDNYYRLFRTNFVLS